MQLSLITLAAAVLLNQLGFQPHGAKRAIVTTLATTPLKWELVDATGAVRANGRTRVFGVNRGSDEHVHVIDFRAFESPGFAYRLKVDGTHSRPFAIANDLYASLRQDALHFFYHQRSGTPVEAARVSDAQWARPAAHAPDRATCYSGVDSQGNRWPGCTYTLDVTGGWYDAGDHGKYVVNGGIAVWTLLDYAERSPFRQKSLLEEARWELDFLLAMQVPQGTALSDLVHHKIHDEHWTALPLAPHQDRERRFLYPPSTAATLNLATVAAQAARVWRATDPAFAARCLDAAQRAFAAARRHPQIPAIGAVDGGGAYGDSDVSDEHYWAAAELYVTTGDEQYARVMRASPHFLAVPEISWSHVAALGTISLSRTAGEDAGRARKSLVAEAEKYLSESEREGYVIPYSVASYNWGSNSAILNRALVLAIAFEFTDRTAFRDGVTDAMDYILGRNPLDQSYVTGYGARPVHNPHHRFWARQIDPAYPPPPPGALSGGPNNTNMRDPVATTMRGKCLPQTCWKDDIRAFTQNEVAINWNAPLFWVAAFLDESQ